MLCFVPPPPPMPSAPVRIAGLDNEELYAEVCEPNEYSFFVVLIFLLQGEDFLEESGRFLESIRAAAARGLGTIEEYLIEESSCSDNQAEENV